jgi:Tol biopolymer transport system component
MPDVREAYEMITKQKPPEPGALQRQQKRQVRAARNKRIGAFAVAAAIGVAAVALILETRGDQHTTTPGNEPPTVAPGSLSGPFFLDLRAGRKTPLPANLAGGYSYVASPDGTKLAYSSSRGGACESGALTVANIDGTDARTLDSPKGLIECAPRWSPDGTKLVYQERAATDVSVGNLFVQEVSSGRRTQVTDLKLSRAWWWFLSPRFSPDGRNVIFHLPRTSSETTKWDVWSVPVTGGEPTLLLRNASFPILNPSGGPEGVAIAFVSPMPNDLAGRSIMTGRPIPESDIRRTLVEAKSSIWWPTMSPDGRKIAYQDGGSIYVVNVSAWDVSSKVAEGDAAEWLDNDTLIVAP